MARNIVRTLVDATQTTMDKWVEKIKEAMQVTEQEFQTYEEKKGELIPKLLEAHEKGVSARQLAKITGINHTTISRWIREAQKLKEAKEEREKQHA